MATYWRMRYHFRFLKNMVCKGQLICYFYLPSNIYISPSVDCPALASYFYVDNWVGAGNQRHHVKLIQRHIHGCNFEFENHHHYFNCKKMSLCLCENTFLPLLTTTNYQWSTFLPVLDVLPWIVLAQKNHHPLNWDNFSVYGVIRK